MNFPEHYLFNVALHAAGLSILVFVAILFMRKPQRVAVAALSGLLAIAILPWFSAWRTGEKPDEAGEPGPMSVSPAVLPQWTVIRIPASQVQDAPVVGRTAKPMALPGPDVLLAYGWAAGGVVLLFGLGVASLRIVSWRRSLHPMDEKAWCRLSENLGDVPLRHSFSISSGSGGPCVAGFFRPLIVVPAYLMELGKERELEWALRHELRHWRGGDSRWTMILEVIRAIHWWNPMVHLLIARWKITREFICDLSAAENDEDRSTYGEFLIAMASRQTSGNPLAVTMVRRQRLKALRSRIVSILEATPGSGTPFEKGVLLSACCGLLGAALLISGVRVGSDLSTLSGAGEFGVVQDSPSGGMAFAEDEPNQAEGGLEKIVQVKVRMKVLVTTDELAANASVRTDAEMQLLMREAAQEKGAMLMTPPVVTMRAGEATMIEVVRENPAKPPWQPDAKNPGERPEGFAGWSYRLESQLEGQKLRVEARIGYGFVPGEHFALDVAAWEKGTERLEDEVNIEVAWDKLVHRKGAATGSLAPGDTMAISLGEVMPGHHGVVFITVTPVDVIGVEVPDFEAAGYELLPAIKGNLKVRGSLIEVNDDARASFGDGSISPAVVSILRETAMKMKETSKTPVIELPEVVIPSGEFRVPWDEVKELSFSAEFLGDASSANVKFRPMRTGFRGTDARGTPTAERLIPRSSAALLHVLPNEKGPQRMMILELDPAD